MGKLHRVGLCGWHVVQPCLLGRIVVSLTGTWVPRLGSLFCLEVLSVACHAGIHLNVATTEG